MAKNGLLCLAVVLLAALSTSEALKCFHCNNCGDDAGTPYDCNDDNDVCLKISLAGRVQKSCAQKAACGLGAVERGVVSAWNNLKNLLSDVDQDVVDIPDDAQAKIVECCESDLCNAASSKMINPVILILLPIIACILRH
ncbi:uncharacterized protein [Palaemon carinicauda]|uniref:uncharacterized protein isoform X1 n=1 Tax=Palaemon carinicauda TaxID=392227 RepID=UPI0035B66737